MSISTIAAGAAIMATLSMHPVKDARNKTNDLFCVAVNAFYEEGGAPLQNKIAVAYATKNRLKKDVWGNSYCEVVHGKNQFSWTLTIKDKQRNWKKTQHRLSDYERSQLYRDWLDAVSAAIIVQWELVPDPTNGATFFCNPKVATMKWCKAMRPTAIIGEHKYGDVAAYQAAIQKVSYTPKPKVRSKR